MVIQNSPYNDFREESAEEHPHSAALLQKEPQSDSESSTIAYDDASYKTRFSRLSLSSRKSLLG